MQGGRDEMQAKEREDVTYEEGRRGGAYLAKRGEILDLLEGEKVVVGYMR